MVSKIWPHQKRMPPMQIFLKIFVRIARLRGVPESISKWPPRQDATAILRLGCPSSSPLQLPMPGHAASGSPWPGPVTVEKWSFYSRSNNGKLFFQGTCSLIYAEIKEFCGVNSGMFIEPQTCRTYQYTCSAASPQNSGVSSSDRSFNLCRVGVGDSLRLGLRKLPICTP